MNYIRHLNNFFAYARNDKRLTPSHISLYMALFQYWNFNRFQNPFPIYRDNLLDVSKIGSKNTYHKCLKDLHKARYVVCHPSVTRFQPVKITITNLDRNLEKDNQQLDLFKKGSMFTGLPNGTNKCPKTGTSASTGNGTGRVPDLTDPGTNNDTGTVPDPGHIIKHINNTNSECKHTHGKILVQKEKIKWKINGPVDEKIDPKNDPSTTITLQQVMAFFTENKYPAPEAKKFFYYNQGKNWMLSNNIPITDWQSVARKWMLNIKTDQTKTNDTDQHSTDAKNYSEPL